MEQHGKNRLIDMTPLLDVILILLFSFLMSVQFEAESYQEQNESLEQEIAETRVKLNEQGLELKEIKSENISLEEQLTEYQKQQEILERATAQFFKEEDMATKSLLQMDLLAQQYFFLEVRIDTENRHQVYINEEATQIYLTGDKRLDEEQKSKDKQKIYDILVQKIDYSGKKFSMLTLIEDRTQYEYASQLLWAVFSDIESAYGAEQIFKIQYFQ